MIVGDPNISKFAIAKLRRDRRRAASPLRSVRPVQRSDDMKLPPLPPTALALLASGCLTISTPPASAALYCVPGITAARCRGTFWESGKLYKKAEPPDAPLLAPDEYTQALSTLDSLRTSITALRSTAEAGDNGAVGTAVAKLRASVRQVGDSVVDSLEGEERLDARQRLLALVRALDDIDEDKAAKGVSKL